MRHPGGKNRAGPGMFQKIRDGLLLGRPAGEDEAGPAAAIGFHTGDGEAGGLAYPGENRDVPLRAADGGMYGVQTGDDALVAPETDRQIPPGVAADGLALQNRLFLHRPLENAERLIFRKERARALRQIYIPAHVIHRPCFSDKTVYAPRCLTVEKKR